LTEKKDGYNEEGSEERPRKSQEKVKKETPSSIYC